MFFFKDTLDAYHFGTVLNEDGSRSNVRYPMPFVSNMPCQMSFQNLDSATPKGNATYPQQRPLEVFLKGIGYGFRRGDWVIVKRNGAAIYEGAVGEPRVYDRLIVHTELGIEAWKKVDNG